jgi:hypothetical protein
MLYFDVLKGDTWLLDRSNESALFSGKLITPENLLRLLRSLYNSH